MSHVAQVRDISYLLCGLHSSEIFREQPEELTEKMSLVAVCRRSDCQHGAGIGSLPYSDKVQGPDGKEMAINDLLSRANNMLQPDLGEG